MDRTTSGSEHPSAFSKRRTIYPNTPLRPSYTHIHVWFRDDHGTVIVIMTYLTYSRLSSGPGFEGLMATKRTNDPSSQARRNSLHDQKPQAGFFGQMWHNFTRGPGSPPK
ncbi:hypothetical protein PG988_008905 [Apiospora saccharicola]